MKNEQFRLSGNLLFTVLHNLPKPLCDQTGKKSSTTYQSEHFICQICTFKNRIRGAFLLFTSICFCACKSVWRFFTARRCFCLSFRLYTSMRPCSKPLCACVSVCIFVSLWLWHASMCVSACKTKQISCTQLSVRSHKRTCSPKGRLTPEATRESNSSWKSSRGQTQSGIIPSNTFTQNICKWCDLDGTECHVEIKVHILELSWLLRICRIIIPQFIQTSCTCMSVMIKD